MIGIIGGTGLYKMEGMEGLEQLEFQTPFGPPSSAVTVGRLGGRKVAFLPRHGAHHQILPSEINYRANIWALKKLGVRHLISVSAVGSLAMECKPADLAIPSQYIDFTKGERGRTFFGSGMVAHISSAQPSCPHLSMAIYHAAKSFDIGIHKDQTYACVEGPRLGTKAESFFLQKSGATLVGMTNVPEVFLAREAQMAYATIAVITDYDCWLDDPSQHVSVEKVIDLYRANIGKVQMVIKKVVETFNGEMELSTREALKFAVMTPPEFLAPQHRELLSVLQQ